MKVRYISDNGKLGTELDVVQDILPSLQIL